MSNNRKRARQRARVICISRQCARLQNLSRKLKESFFTMGLVARKVAKVCTSILKKDLQLVLLEREINRRAANGQISNN
jgi:hypothetical protein